ncbi:MAG TPA: hypothetical protein VMB18_12865 [Terriglobales bacterium]|nr:hypothetical protein [Terriglobales bacterium]
MKKFRNWFRLLVLLIMVVGAIGLHRRARGQALRAAQQQTSPIQQEQVQLQDEPELGPAQEIKPNSTQVLTGRVMQSQDRLVLMDLKSKTMYLLDDEGPAQPFVGKCVAVRGKMTASNTIHIFDINMTATAD